MNYGEIFLSLFVAGLAYLIWCENWKLDDDYDELPKLFKLEDYEGCMEDPDALYCLVDIELSTEKPTELWNRIKNMSSQPMKYFRHDILHRGICVSRSCDVSGVPLSILQTDKSLLREVLQNCALRELTNEYGFGGNVTAERCESNKRSEIAIKGSWIYTGAIIFIILANIVGSVFAADIDVNKGITNRCLNAFSVPNNWNKITKTKGKGRGWMQGMQGLRVIIMLIVILDHFYLAVYSMYIDNSDLIEMFQGTNTLKVFFNTSLLMQVNFAIASFLMTHSLLKYSDKRKSISIIKTHFPLMIERWLRLTPALAVTIGFFAYWSTWLLSGPMWAEYHVGKEACQNYWWTYLLYINNIVHSAIPCMIQAWYLAVDLQLLSAGLLVVLLVCKFPQSTKLVLSVTSMVAIFTPGLITYFMGYPTMMDSTAENYREMFSNDDTFKYIYVTFQGNYCGYTVGLVAGYIQFWIEKNKLNLCHKKWVPFIINAIIPMTIGTMALGVWLLSQRANVNPFTSALFASLAKPFIAALFSFLTICMANNCDVGIFKILESRIFNIPGKLTYCVLLVHFEVQNYLHSLLTYPVQVGFFTLVILPAASILLTYCVALVLSLLVEYPFHNLQTVNRIDKKNKDELGSKNDSKITSGLLKQD